MVSRRRLDEIGQIIGASLQILEIEDTFRQPAEESRVAVLRDLAARTEERRRWVQFVAQRQQVVLVSAGTVQDQQRAIRRTGDKLVDEIQVSSHELKNSSTASTTARCIAAVSSG
jgi:hypothetical protein